MFYEIFCEILLNLLYLCRRFAWVLAGWLAPSSTSHETLRLPTAAAVRHFIVEAGEVNISSTVTLSKYVTLTAGR